MGNLFVQIATRRKAIQLTQTPNDRVKLRPFQEELSQVVQDRVAEGHAHTIAWVNAGSGKTLGYQHTANTMFREGLIDGLITLAPRLTLRKQGELDWSAAPGAIRPGHPGGFMHLYGDPKMGLIVARGNSHGRDGVSGAIRSITDNRHFGYITTYSSLVSDPGVHYAWARDRSRRFLLVCDEAQFLGLDDDDGGGTAAARCVETLAELALHTVLLTGTPFRSDRQKLVLCANDYTEPDERGERRLRWHVRATYRQGVAAGYLRDFQSDLDHGSGRFSNGEDFDIATLDQRLGVVVTDPRVWHGLVDSVVERLLDVRRLDRRYQALICVGSQDQADEVMTYLAAHRPNLHAVKSISRQQGKEAQSALDGFRAGIGDVLVTVSKAYIGYDCKQITVIGLLTSWRWDGYLQQIVARGLRVWDERPVREQTCYVIGPADPRLVKFCVDMRGDAEKGLRERRDTEGGDGPIKGDDVAVDEFTYRGREVKGMDVDSDLTDTELREVQALREEVQMNDSEAKIGKLLRSIGYQFRLGSQEPAPSQPPETEEEQRARLGNDCNRLIGRLVRQTWGELERRELNERFKVVQNDLSDAQGLPRGRIKHYSVDEMLARRRLILSWINKTRVSP
jgi:superfamily II DNA or RNA helicase